MHQIWGMRDCPTKHDQTRPGWFPSAGVVLCDLHLLSAAMGEFVGCNSTLTWAAETWGNSTRPSASKWKTLTDGDASSKPAALETHGKSGWTIHYLRPWDTTSFNGKASFGSWRCRLVQMFNSVFNFNLSLRKHLESFGQILEKLVLKFGWTHAMSDFVYKA